MEQTHAGLAYLLAIARLDAVLSRKSFLNLGFSDFVILHHLMEAEGERLRRVDLAEKVGLTASGVTRMLLPMEKIGLVEREVNPQDARVSFVCITKAGKRLYQESREGVEAVADTVTAEMSKKDILRLQEALHEAVKSI